MKKVLITGVAGFIGSNLDAFISERLHGFEVYGIDVSLKRPDERHFKGDLKNRGFLKKIITKIKPDYIFHLAGSTEKGSFYNLFLDNVVTTNSILDSLLGLKNFKTRIIIPGSAAEYGHVSNKDMPVKESQSLEPINYYGLSKMCQSRLALTFCKRGLDIVIGRIFNILGWATPRDFSIGRFAYEISLIKKGKKKAFIETRGLNSERDYLDIQDVCSGLMAIAEKGKKGNVYNICSGEVYKIKNALDYLLGLADLKKVKIKASPSSGPEVRTIRGSNTKIIRHAKWRPEISISESLKKTLDYYNRRIR